MCGTEHYKHDLIFQYLLLALLPTSQSKIKYNFYAKV